MAAPVSTPLPSAHPKGFGATFRRDAWWIYPSFLAFLLIGFVVYSTWAGLQSGFHWANGTNYLTPFYSPEIWGTSPHAFILGIPAWWPVNLMAFSSAFLILAAPAGFRFTCYYYRKAYYRSLWADPVACAVGEARSGFWGENRLPLILLNLHRYFLYLALAFAVLLLVDGIKSFWFPVDAGGMQHFWNNSQGQRIAGELYAQTAANVIDAKAGPAGWSFGIGLGSLILLINPLLIMGYTFGCHSLRHFVGGGCDRYRTPVQKARHGLWRVVTWFNGKHEMWAMLSLVWVGLSDLYVRGLAHGWWTETYLVNPFK